MNTTSDYSPRVISELSDGVLMLTLNAPLTGNALDVAMTEALADALEPVNRHPASVASCCVRRGSIFALAATSRT